MPAMRLLILHIVCKDSPLQLITQGKDSQRTLTPGCCAGCGCQSLHLAAPCQNTPGSARCAACVIHVAARREFILKKGHPIIVHRYSGTLCGLLFFGEAK